jgi:uncharacterized protein YdhG (YjbR/CyaY superfamily)
MKPAQKTKTSGFSAEERAAMRERARELKAESRKGDGERAALAAIAKLPPQDRKMAERFHALVRSNAPHLVPRTWYGMPAYGDGDNVICFFQSGEKFKTRYATIGFSDKAKLDVGGMWPTAYALKELTDAEADKIAKLIKKAVR